MKTSSCFVDSLGAYGLNAAYLRCFLVGAVARVLNEDSTGVKMDTVLVLDGPQGCGKTSFFNMLAGEFFSERCVPLGTARLPSDVQSAWITEWTDLEDQASGPNSSRVHRFLSSSTYRTSSRTKYEEKPRRGVFVATTTEGGYFSRNPTKSRHFHVIKVGKAHVNVELLASMRDQLWAEAAHYYRNGVQWWLTKEEEAMRGAP